MSKRSIFIGGTSSHAGKSWMTTAVCRYLRRRGLRVAPFKAQNMSNNSFPCVEGGEIGRAQVAQAEACGLAPSSDMNPILLKPNGDGTSQVVVDGRVWRTLAPREYYEHFEFLLGRALDAYSRLAKAYDVVVMEGAGSVSELNLRRTDLVNFGLATRVGAASLLVADIERGGVFASLIGTAVMLDSDERALVRMFAVNKFRGDRSLFDDGVPILENKTGWKCLGVFPFDSTIHLDEEDSVALGEMSDETSNVAVIRLPCISNFTDFRLIRAQWVQRPVERIFETIFLPGTKDTLSDLRWLRSTGMAEWLQTQHSLGASVIGVCGGYQMLGRRVGDVDGLGLLPVETDFAAEKTTRVVTAELPSGHRFGAYEIHMGHTSRAGDAIPFAFVDGRPEGIRDGRVVGTYLHGAFEDAGVVSAVLNLNFPQASREPHYEALARWLESHADMRAFEEAYL